MMYKMLVIILLIHYALIFILQLNAKQIIDRYLFNNVKNFQLTKLIFNECDCSFNFFLITIKAYKTYLIY